MTDTIQSTDERLKQFAKVAVTEIAMTERGVEFYNEAGEVVFILPFAKDGD